MDFDNCYTVEELDLLEKRNNSNCIFSIGDLVLFKKKKYFVFSRNCGIGTENWYTLKPFKWNGDYDSLTWAFESELTLTIKYIQLSLFQD